MIGHNVRERLFKFENPLMKKIKIGDLWFDVIGVIADKNVSSGGMGMRNFNDDIYIPLSTMMYKITKSAASEGEVTGMVFFYGNEEEVANVVDRSTVDQLTVKVQDSNVLKEAADLTRRVLDRRHYGVKDYEIVLPEQLLEQKQKTQRIFNIVMGAIAGISLLVGGIGIMNIMLANILERTKEIGIRRAVGATRRDVLSQFMFEAIIISIIGGIIGIIVGYIMTSLISRYAEWNTIISPTAVILAFIVSVATGLLFGIYPAKQAADKDPIESLRYE